MLTPMGWIHTKQIKDNHTIKTHPLLQCMKLLWIILKCFQMFWNYLTYFVMCWNTLKYFEMLWYALACFGMLWQIQMLWHAFNCFDMLWSELKLFKKQMKSFQSPLICCDMCVCVVINALKCFERCSNALEKHWNAMNMLCHALTCVEIIENVMLWNVWK